MTKTPGLVILWNTGALPMKNEVIKQVRPGEWLIHEPGLPAESCWFDHQHWLDQGRLLGANSGRGSAWMVRASEGKWMLRHYFRGGLPARLNRDKYFWRGLENTRAVAEWRLLRRMQGEGLPVPAPVAARVRKKGWLYMADLLMQFLPHEQTFGRFLLSADAERNPAAWQQAGHAIGQLHGRGYYHADLNVHNILLSKEKAWLIDFDRGRYLGQLSAVSGWQQDNLRRLRRSIDKVLGAGQGLPADVLESGWQALLAAYERSRVESVQERA